MAADGYGEANFASASNNHLRQHELAPDRVHGRQRIRAAPPDAAAAAYGAKGIVSAEEGADFLAGAVAGDWHGITCSAAAESSARVEEVDV